MSSAGLRTTVLPQTSAGQSFQAGIAIGKFQGVIAPTTPTGMRTLIMNLSRQLARRRLAEEAPALAGHVVAHVDRLLDVAAGLGAHLPHLARHQVGQLVLVVAQELGEAEEDRAALGRRHEPPVLERRLRRGDRALDVGGARARERRRASRRSPGRSTRSSPRPRPSTHSPPTKLPRAGATAMAAILARLRARRRRSRERADDAGAAAVADLRARSATAPSLGRVPAVGPVAAVDDHRHVGVVGVVGDHPVVQLVDPSSRGTTQ